jgi:hypothetical protein
VNAPRVGRRFCFGETDNELRRGKPRRIGSAAKIKDAASREVFDPTRNKKANETGAPPPLRSAIQTVLIGGLAAAVAFMIDRVIS